MQALLNRSPLLVAYYARDRLLQRDVDVRQVRCGSGNGKGFGRPVTFRSREPVHSGRVSGLCADLLSAQIDLRSLHSPNILRQVDKQRDKTHRRIELGPDRDSLPPNELLKKFHMSPNKDEVAEANATSLTEKFFVVADAMLKMVGVCLTSATQCRFIIQYFNLAIRFYGLHCRPRRRVTT